MKKLILVIPIIFLVYFAIFGRALRQNENHIKILFALPRVILSGTALIDENTYLSKDRDVFIKQMEKEGFIYFEQMGSGYIFTKNQNKYNSGSRMYSSFFMLHSYPKKQKSLAEQIRECMPKSDVASRDRCLALFKQVTNFQECVEVGFALGVNPEKCELPDGTVFLNNIKRINLRGLFVCLPYKDPNILHNDLCVRGVLTDSDKYYGLSFLLLQTTSTSFPAGIWVSARGVLLPKEKYSSQEWENFDIEGVLEVTEITEYDRLFGFIRSINGSEFSIDLAEMLSGAEAKKVGSEDTGCPVSKIEECIPSLNNDFYIRNLSTSTKKFELSKNAIINRLLNYGSPVLVTTTPSNFIKYYSKVIKEGAFKQPFHFKIKDKMIIEMEEQYTP